jgi:hypothetical protein
MKFLLPIAAAFILFISGYGLGTYRAGRERLKGLESEFARISHTELRDYQNLKDERAKYDKANEILSRIMMIFLADLGLHLENTRPDFLAGISKPPEEKECAPCAQAQEPSRSRMVKVSEEGPQPRFISKKKEEKNFRKNPTSTVGHQVVSKEEARGATYALYQAIVWREPDAEGGKSAERQMIAVGWENYIRKAQDAITSHEFQNTIEPNHSVEEIINRIYAVYFGRCANRLEMSDQLSVLNREGAKRMIAGILNKARENNLKQIYSGGYNPNSCSI